MTRYFDGIELSSDYGKKKPSYDFFLYLARKYGLDLAETVYIGNDFSCDILPAKSLGMKAVYVHTDISPADDDFDEVAKVADFASDNDFLKAGEYLLSCVQKEELDE